MNNLLEKMICGTDSYGNEYSFDNENVFLKLNSENRVRNIGKIVNRESEVLYIKYEEEDQRFRKTDAWSINWRICSNVDWIYFITSEDSYKIHTFDARRYGKFFHFKSSTELKLYVPVDHWIKKSEIKQ